MLFICFLGALAPPDQHVAVAFILLLLALLAFPPLWRLPSTMKAAPAWARWVVAILLVGLAAVVDPTLGSNDAAAGASAQATQTAAPAAAHPSPTR